MLIIKRSHLKKQLSQVTGYLDNGEGATRVGPLVYTIDIRHRVGPIVTNYMRFYGILIVDF